MGGETIMRKILLLAALAIFAVTPAFASVQNVKVSGDINSIWLVRDHFDLGDQGDINRYQNLLITQARLRVDADLTDNVSTTIRLLNERTWGSSGDNTSESEEIELNLAYVTLREMLYSPLTVVVGRQEFKYGNSFVIDSAGPNNSTSSGGLNGVAEDLSLRRAQDAVRMILDYNPLTIDIVASKVDSGSTDSLLPQDDDIDLFGFNANYQLGDDMNSVIEGYFWSKLDQGAKDDAIGNKVDSVYMPGVHASTNVLDGLMLSAEAAWQFGTKVASSTFAPDPAERNIKRDAFGAQLLANYKVPLEATKQYSPVLTTGYTYVSGDKGAADGKNPGNKDERYTAWDPMFENQGKDTIYNTLFNLTNAHIATIRGQIKPMEDLTALMEYNGIWLAKELRDTTTPDNGNCTGADCITLVQPDGNSSTPLMVSNLKLGDEVDMKLVYDYTEDVQIGAMMGYFWPGPAFDDRNQKTAVQYMLNANVNF
jgi:hypothetical protein